jgi:hypothetical protein
MDLLQNLLGGGQQRQQFEDFANRYEQGPPYDGYSGNEAYERYQQVAPHLPPDVYQDAARDAFNRMSPQERMQLGQHMQRQAQQRGYNDPAWTDPDDMYQDPNYLAQLTGRMHQQQPGILGQLFGGGGMQQSMGGQPSGAGDLLNNPLAKAALGGIAAMALRRMMSGGLGGQQGPTRTGGNNPFGGIKM